MRESLSKEVALCCEPGQEQSGKQAAKQPVQRPSGWKASSQCLKEGREKEKTREQGRGHIFFLLGYSCFTMLY